VLGDRGAAQVELLSEVSSDPRTLGKDLQEAPTHRVGQCGENRVIGHEQECVNYPRRIGGGRRGRPVSEAPRCKDC